MWKDCNIFAKNIASAGYIGTYLDRNEVRNEIRERFNNLRNFLPYVGCGYYFAECSLIMRNKYLPEVDNCSARVLFSTFVIKNDACTE